MGTGSLIANAGTPLMWGSLFMLVFGNYLIGRLEHFLIAKKYEAVVKSWIPMVIANYVSMAVGIAMLYYADPYLDAVRERPFKFGLIFIVCSWLAAFIVSVIVEWPFVAKTARMRLGIKSLKASVFVQLVSYAFLILFVHLLGSVSALTGLREVALSNIETVGGWLYYIDDSGSEIKRIRLDGSRRQHVAAIKYKPDVSPERVLVQPSKDEDVADIMLHDGTNAANVVLRKVGSKNQAAPVERDDDGVPVYGTFGLFSARCFVDAPTIYVGFWPREGLLIDGDRYALETPFIARAWRNAVVLPDRKVIAQFGATIYLIDQVSGHIAPLVGGTGGDVLLDVPAASGN